MQPDEKLNWIAVDLDGTLAEYHGWTADGKIGKPVGLMVSRVKKWLSEGKRVKIFTARVGFDNSQVPEIHAWLEEQGLPKLEITATKDLYMKELWDDRCIQVIRNTGIPIADLWERKA